MCCQSEQTYLYSQSVLYQLAAYPDPSVNAKNIKRLIQELENAALEKYDSEFRNEKTKKNRSHSPRNDLFLTEEILYIK